MGLKCRISYSASGQATVTDANGNASKLFADALAVTQDQNAALNIWASAYTPEFQETFGTTSQTEEPPVLQVIKYYQSLKQLDGRLEPKELFEVRQMMRTAGIRNLSDFSAMLKSIFLQGDVPGIDENLAIESGLFLPEDLNSIDLPKVVDLIGRMEGETLSNDFEVEPQDSEILYRDTAHKNIFGASETVTIEQIDSEVIDLIDNFQSEEEFYNKLQELPYSDFTARFYEDEAFANEYMAKFQGLVKVPVIEERAGELVSDVTPTFSTVKNTILDGLDSISIDADISFINSIADNIWEANAETVSSVVQEIEAELATKNIDIIGLHNITTDKATLLEMLNAASVMVENPTDANILTFSQVYDKTFLRQPAKKVVKVLGNLQGLTLVSMYSAKTDQQLFDQHGLIKVGDNLYHKVDLTADISDAYEYLYQQMRDGAFQIPYQYRTEMNMDNKPAILQDIAEFVNARETGLGFYNEKASLYQVVFGHPAINLVKESDMATSALNTLTTNEVYLKTDFVSDFYSMILQEKLADSPAYRNTLSKFSVTDNDITLTSDLVSDLTDIPMYQELMDYIKLRKNSSMKKFLPAEMMGDTNAAFSAYNFPTTVAQYTGPKAETQNLVVTPPIADDFIRIEDTVYQKVKVSETANVFLRLKPNNNSAYYTTTPAFTNFTQEQIDRAAQTDMVTNTKLTGKDINARKEKSGVLSRLVNNIKARSTSLVSKTQQQTTKAFETNLVEFLRQKGLPVVTDLAEMKAALAELGIDSVNQMFRFEDIGVKSTVSININGNRLTVSPSINSKVKTPQQAYGVASSIFQKARKYVQDTAGPLFRENMVVREGTTITLNIPADMQERVEQMRAVEDEITRILEEQKQENDLVDYDPAKEELERGVSPDVLRDLGYNMLQTPAGTILGFEYKGTIYLDPTLLNNVTTLHELTHVFQTLVKARANAGDTQAQKILQKREEIFGAMAREWEVFHKTLGAEPNFTRTFNALMVGIDGGYNLNSPEGATTVVGLLNMAKKLEQVYGIQKTDWVEAKTDKGLTSRRRATNRILKDKTLNLTKEDKAFIEQDTVSYERVRDILLRIKYRTGWSRGADGQWRYEIEDNDAKVNIGILKQNTGFFADDMTLEEVLDHPELYKAYPRLKNVSVNVWNDIDYSDANYSRYDNTISINVASLPESQIKAKLLHEVQHAIQNIEGFATMGAAEIAQMSMAGQIPGLSREGYDTIEEAAYEGVRSIAQLVEEGKTINDIIEGNYSQFFFGSNPQTLVEYYISENPELRDIFTRAKDASQEVQADLANMLVSNLSEILDTKPAFDLYLNNISEVEARNVEARLKLTPEERKNSLLQDTEDVVRDEQVTIENGAGKTVVGSYPLFQSTTSFSTLQPGEVAPQFQFIGEGNRLTNNDRAALTLAKQLEADNKTPEEIYKKTNWLKTNQGIWIREIGDLKVIPPTEKELDKEVKNILRNKEVVYDVEDLFDISEIGNRYNFDNLKIKVTYERNEKNQTISFASINSKGERSITTLIKGSEDYLRRYLGGENIGEIVINRRGPRGTDRITAVQSFQSIINHEFQHILQAQDSTRKIGNSFNEIVKFFIRKNISAFPDIESISRDEVFNRLERIYQKEDFAKYAETLYRNSTGERQATEVELRMFDKSTLPENFEGAFNVDIQDVQKGIANFQVDAYHGTPYSFDRFSTEAIGTGEGHQAFGWGLYFTDLKSIAENYADAVGKQDSYLANAVDESQMSDEAKTLAKGHYFESRDRNEAVKLLQYNKGLSDNREDFDQAITFLKRFNPPRNLYKVSLHQGKSPSEYTWLIWDKKLSPEVKEKIKKGIGARNFQSRKQELDVLFTENLNKITDKVSDKRALNFVIENFDKSASYEKVTKELTEDEVNILRDLNTIYKESKRINEILDFDYQLNNFNGNNIYNQLKSMLGSSKEASLFLLESGVDGVKYPAESVSRGATSDTARGFNYVVFDENAVSIEEVVSFQASREMIDAIGLDLSAPVYAQRQGESDADYHNRLVNEVEAYVTAPEIAQKLEELRQTNPSLWSRITDFIKNLTTWLKTQIGLSDYEGDIMNMTKEEYTSALGVSILKEEYDDLFVPNNSNKIANEVINATVVLDSQVEMISLQTEEAQDALYNKIDNCG